MSLDKSLARKKELEQKMQEMRREIEEIQAQQKKPLIAQIVDMMAEFEISIDDIEPPLRQRLGLPARGSKRAGNPAPIKYRHPETHQTWSGRGRSPRWLLDEEAKGKSRNDFLVDR